MGRIPIKIYALIFAALTAIAGIIGILLLRSSEGVVPEDAGVGERISYVVTAPDPFNLKKGNIKHVRILFSSQYGNSYENISAVGVRLTYSGDGIISSKEGKSSAIIYPSEFYANQGDWAFPVNKVEKNADQYIIEFVAANVNTEGFVAKEFTPIVDMYVELSDVNIDLADFKIDEVATYIMSKEDLPKNIYSGQTNLRLEVVE